jgi:hypothetical protein
MSAPEQADPEIPHNIRFLECANWLVNRIEGKTVKEISNKDFRLLSASTLAETETAMVLACQIGGCSVQWAMNKNSDGTFGREMQVGLSACPSQ